MSINHKQFTKLQEMGISLWQQKNISIDTKIPQSIEINIKMLSQHDLFNDILLSLGLSLGEISCQNNQVSLGLLNWQFREQHDISMDNNLLTTPNIKNIQQTPSLKAQLWQQIQEHRLT